jgi:hypothetical protein|nr:MAG TPA: hypothetical protein [Caudoviricetes sp.]
MAQKPTKQKLDLVPFGISGFFLPAHSGVTA